MKMQNIRLYTKLAWNGIKKNSQLYVPYLISGITMVMVFYILSFLADSGLVHNLRGGAAMSTLLLSGTWLMGLFSLPFLIYTSSSLIRRRKKELALYKILGMNKKNIFALLLWETLITYAVVVCAGLFVGILFSKAAELGLVNIMGEETDYRIYVEWKAVLTVILLYAAVYLMIFLNMVRQVRHNNLVVLMHSESVGERPPKGRWLLAAAGVLITAAGYALALFAENGRRVFAQSFPIAALIIIGTYLLFIAGSVFLCRMLQKDKRYYYQTAHFVTVSSLSYRMKRNGASLASICILSTAILVALAGSVGFYAGTESIIKEQYPYDLGLLVKEPDGQTGSGDGSSFAAYRDAMEQTLQELDAVVAFSAEISFGALFIPVTDGVPDLGFDLRKDAPAKGDDQKWQEYLEPLFCVRILSLADYNRLCHTEEELGAGEVLIAGDDADAWADYIRSWDQKEYTVKKKAEEMPHLSPFRLYGMNTNMLEHQFVLVVADTEQFWKSYDASGWASKNPVTFFCEYAADLAEDTDRQLAVYEAAAPKIREIADKNGDQGEKEDYNYYARAERSGTLKSLSGGLMFLAFVLCLVFIFVAAWIMYYKQISEGYEDRRQFAIMKKIGMTKKEIRRSINSQMLTVFCFPLLIAGIHLCFALPVIYQVMKYSVFDNKPLLIQVTAVSFLLFAIVYAFVYMLTTRTYFRIVNQSGAQFR